MLAVIHGACILTDRKIDETFDRAVLTELRNIDGIAVRRKEIDDLKLALCDRTGLITEENVQGPCCLDTDRLADKDVMVEHAARILHENERDHERQTFRDRTDDDNDRKRYRIDDLGKDCLEAHSEECGHAAGLQDIERNVQYGNHGRADIAEYRDLMGKFRKLDLQRGIRLVFLHFLGHFSHHGLEAYLADVKSALTVDNDCPSEQRMFVDKGISRDIVPEIKALIRCSLLTFLRLTVQCGVIDPDRSVDQDTVRRDLVACLQQDLVAADNVVHLNDSDDPVALRLTFILLRAVLQLAVLGIARDVGLR